jgi:hypothetical protein
VGVGSWFIKVTRTAITPNEEILVRVEITEAETIDTSGTKKVWLEINQNNINDPALNDANGTTAGSIQTGASYPASNYIPLADIVGGVITDDRTFINPKEDVELRGSTIPRGTLIPVTEDYTFTGTERNNSELDIYTTTGNINIDLDLSLFNTTRGFYRFTFSKVTADANTITIDVWAGSNIDGGQTYELGAEYETVTLEIHNSTFAKVLSTAKAPSGLDIWSLPEITELVDTDEAIINRPWEGNKKITLWELKNKLEITTNKLKLIAWENLSVGDALRFWTNYWTYNFTWSATSAANEVWGIWYNSTWESAGFQRTFWVKWFLKEVTIDLYRTWSPWGNLSARLYDIADLVNPVATSTNTFAENSLTTSSSWQPVTFNFDTDYNIDETKTYAVRIFADRAFSTSNYSRLATYYWTWTADQSRYYSDSDTLSNSYSKLTYQQVIIFWTTQEDSTKVFKTSANDIETTNFIWFSTQTVNNNDEVIIDISGITDVFTGLTPYILYYLSNTAGLISSTPPTNSVLVWRSEPNDLFLINNGWF